MTNKYSPGNILFVNQFTSKQLAQWFVAAIYEGDLSELYLRLVFNEEYNYDRFVIDLLGERDSQPRDCDIRRFKGWKPVTLNIWEDDKFQVEIYKSRKLYELMNDDK